TGCGTTSILPSSVKTPPPVCGYNSPGVVAFPEPGVSMGTVSMALMTGVSPGIVSSSSTTPTATSSSGFLGSISSCSDGWLAEASSLGLVPNAGPLVMLTGTPTGHLANPPSSCSSSSSPSISSACILPSTCLEEDLLLMSETTTPALNKRTAGIPLGQMGQMQSNGDFQPVSGASAGLGVVGLVGDIDGRTRASPSRTVISNPTNLPAGDSFVTLTPAPGDPLPQATLNGIALLMPVVPVPGHQAPSSAFAASGSPVSTSSARTLGGRLGGKSSAPPTATISASSCSGSNIGSTDLASGTSTNITQNVLCIGNEALGASREQLSSEIAMAATVAKATTTTTMVTANLVTSGMGTSGDKKCKVCGDKAVNHNFGQLTCESCKAFFRRNAHKVGI
ncbi:unnamed protein product, partial [Protopolystoma xenopodis]